jgi:hypothetical protein
MITQLGKLDGCFNGIYRGKAKRYLLGKLDGLSEGLDNGCFDGMSKGEAEGN